MQILPKRVTELRIIKRMSQKELADAVTTEDLKVRPQSINQLEKGEVAAPRYLLKLAEVLNTTPQYLLGETAESARSEILSPDFEMGFFTEDQIKEAVIGVMTSPSNRTHKPEIIADLVISLAIVLQQRRNQNDDNEREKA